MPYKDLKARAAYALAHSKLPAQRLKQKERRASPGYKEYLDPIQRKNVLQRYGLTPETYADLLEKQGHACAVCQTTIPGNGRGDRRFDVDHNHKTGKVRGLLCRNCNVTLGVLENKRDRLAKLEEYLLKTDA